MNLQKLFNMQAELDEHIMSQHPEMRGQNNLDWKLLALQVELAECANEWRGFKKWSKDQEPHTKKEVMKWCVWCNGKGEDSLSRCPQCDGDGEVVDYIKNPLLEEYVDCLHFILSIGLEIGYENSSNESWNEYKKSAFGNRKNGITELFINLNWLVGCIYENEIHYEQTLFELLGLSEMLGFTWEQVEEAYLEKNKTNHERQLNNY